MKYIVKLSEALDKITKAAIALLLIEMTVVYFAQVVARFAFNSGLSWSEEMVRYSCIAMIFLAAASLFRAVDHIAITILEELLPKPVRKYQFAIVTLINLVYMAMLLVFGLQILPMAALQLSPNMQIPMNIIYLLFPISAALMIIHAIALLVDRQTYEKYKIQPAAQEGTL